MSEQLQSIVESVRQLPRDDLPLLIGELLGIALSLLVTTSPPQAPADEEQALSRAAAARLLGIGMATVEKSRGRELEPFRIPPLKANGAKRYSRKKILQHITGESARKSKGAA